MKVLRKLIHLHIPLFCMAVLLIFLTVVLNMRWNGFLADVLNILVDFTSSQSELTKKVTLEILVLGVFLIIIVTLCEYIANYVVSYTCELWAHDMRIGYAKYYLFSNIQSLDRLNVGEEQSAMQNELRDISNNLKENLFLFMKQFVTFAVTVIFLLNQNFKLALSSVLPVIPLIIYCFVSGKVIKNYTEQCQNNKQQINGLINVVLELFPVIQLYNACALMNNAFDCRIKEWQKSSVKKERIAAKLMSLSGVLSFIPLLVMLGIGGFMVIEGEISIGIFYIFINLSGNVSGFLQNMPNIYAGFRSFNASANRVERKMILEEK